MSKYPFLEGLEKVTFGNPRQTWVIAELKDWQKDYLNDKLDNRAEGKPASRPMLGKLTTVKARAGFYVYHDEATGTSWSIESHYYETGVAWNFARLDGWEDTPEKNGSEDMYNTKWQCLEALDYWLSVRHEEQYRKTTGLH